MLVDTNMTISQEHTTIRGKPDKSCPQGGVLSPLLCCLVVNDLSQDLQKEGFLVYGYADDTAILVRGNVHNTLRDLTANALRIVQRRCETKGLRTNPLKTNIMVFTRKYKSEPKEPLRLRERKIAFTCLVKYLVVLLDPALNWKPKKKGGGKEIKFYCSMWVCRKTMGKTWQLPQSSPVDVQDSLAATNTVCISGLVAVRSMKTTPTEVLEVALCLNPLNLAVTGAARFTAYGLNCQGEWRNTGLGHRKLELFQKHPLKLTKDRILKKYQLVIQYKVLIPIREDWCMLGKIANPNVIWYTDRSGIKNRFGAGIYGPRDNHKENIPVG